MKIKKFHIIRALPGSGKSELARDLETGNDAVIISLDKLRTQPNGTYEYDALKVKDLVIQMDRQIIEALQNEVPMIILDNTHHLKDIVLKYKSLALHYGYWVTIIEIPHEDPKILAARNTHGITEQRIRKFITRWESVGYDLPFQRMLRKVKHFLRPWKRKTILPVTEK